MSHTKLTPSFTSYIPVLPFRGENLQCSTVPRRAVFRNRRRIPQSSALDPSPRRHGTPRDVSVVLLAGGRGTRMESKTPKQLLPLRGESVLERSLRAFEGLPEVREIIVVLAEDLRAGFAGTLCSAHGARFASPGPDRADSVRNGVDACAADATLIAVHDAARPLVRRERVREVIRDAWAFGAAVLAVPCKATVKTSADGEFVGETLDRRILWEMQTPQVVDAAILRRGLGETKRNDVVVTDDVSVVEYLGLPVRLTVGDYCNLKITTQEDLVFADAILEDRARKEARAVTG